MLLYRWATAGALEVLVAHPGGPYWARRERGAWSIPKGELEAGEDPRAAAVREFAEETGVPLEASRLRSLGSVRQRGGKIVHGFACEGDLDPDAVRSNLVRTTWPPGSGRTVEFPEIDRVAWVSLAAARRRLNPAQHAFLDRLRDLLDHGK